MILATAPTAVALTSTPPTRTARHVMGVVPVSDIEPLSNSPSEADCPCSCHMREGGWSMWLSCCRHPTPTDEPLTNSGEHERSLDFLDERSLQPDSMCCDHLHGCGQDARHWHECCRHWHGRETNEPLSSGQPPPRELVTAIEHLIDDYGMPAVFAALDELTRWYAND